MNQLAYPLQWPAGWPRAQVRISGNFDGTLDRIRWELLKEIDAIVLGREARTHYVTRNTIVISTNLPLRKDGEFNASVRDPADPGVAVYFERKKVPVCFACDKYDRVWKNLRAIQRTIEAMRGIERWGSSQLLDRAFTGFAALPGRSGASCFDVLGVDCNADEAEILAAWREKAKAAHPDAGGSHEGMAALNEAKDLALSAARNRRAMA